MRAFKGVSTRLPAVIGFRPITDSDLPFLSRLYASTRAEEVAQVMDWTAEQKQQFLQMQFDAQHKFYQEQFKQAEFLLIEQDQQPIGRIYIDRREDETRLIDIALMPETRGPVRRFTRRSHRFKVARQNPCREKQPCNAFIYPLRFSSSGRPRRL